MFIKKILFLALLLSLMPNMLHCIKKNYALIIVPVCDSGETPRLLLKDSQKTFAQLPFSGGINQFVSCPRVHQFLFNETVEIVDSKDDRVQVKASNAWYNVKGSKEPQDLFWIDRITIIPFKKLKSKGVDIRKIPSSIAKDTVSSDSNSIVTLIMPFFDSITNKTYSTGTRFIKNDPSEHNADCVQVLIFDPNSFEFVTTHIPKTLIFNEQSSSKQEKIAAFVNLLKNWAHLEHGFIPYVWGGSSFTKALTGQFVELFAQFQGINTSFFDYPNSNMNPKSGFDCSSLICRAAQIVGIPYYFKNTYTITQNLHTVTTEALEEGDLILVSKGSSYVHVMAISSIKENLLIEAGSYKFGYGKVHETSLAKTFSGLKTYKELIKAANNNEVLLRLHKNGSIIEANQVRLFKLKSLWQ